MCVSAAEYGKRRGKVSRIDDDECITRPRPRVQLCETDLTNDKYRVKLLKRVRLLLLL